GRGRREQRPDVAQQVRRPLDEYDFLPLLVRHVVLFGDPQQLLAQEKDVAIEHRIRLRLDGLSRDDARYTILAPALRAFHQSSGKFVLQLVRPAAQTGDSDGHGCLRSDVHESLACQTCAPEEIPPATPGARNASYSRPDRPARS